MNPKEDKKFLSNPLLENNFREIYQVIKSPSELIRPLVADISGKRLYDSRYGWGRLWCWFYRVIEWVSPNDRHSERLQRAILHTHSIFRRELSRIQKPLSQYLEYLEKCGKGYSVSEAAYFPARKSITKWNDATNYFLKLIQNTDAVKLLFQSICSNLPPLSFKVQNKPGYNFSFTRDCRSCQKIIDLEGLLGEPLPLSILKKIIRNIPPNAIDQKELIKWTDKIEKLNIEAKPVHKALKAVVLRYAKKNKSREIFPKTLTDVELYLEDYGCKVFQKPDIKHLKWRQNLKKRTKFTLNNREIILGNEIFPKQSGSDQTRAYYVEGQPNRVALIAQNNIALPLRDLRMRQENHFGMEPALFLDISSDGRIALIERLKALNTLQWTSANGQLSPEDGPIVNKLSNLVKEFAAHNFTPSNFSSASLMFDEQLQLKFLKPLKKGLFDFNALEDFISECSAGNPTIFKEMMAKSGLNSLPAAKFYSTIISNVLNGDEIAPDDLAGIYKIGDPKIVDRAAALTEQVASKKRQLELQLREQHPKLPPAQLNKKINQKIYADYLESKTSGILKNQ